jgi:hypothetical protein
MNIIEISDFCLSKQIETLLILNVTHAKNAQSWWCYKHTKYVVQEHVLLTLKGRGSQTLKNRGHTHPLLLTHRLADYK